MNSLTTENRNLLMLEIPTFAANQQAVTVVGGIILVAKKWHHVLLKSPKNAPKLPKPQMFCQFLVAAIICNP